MRTVIGHFGGYVTALGVLTLGLGISQSTRAADSPQLIRFSSPRDVVHPPNDAAVSLASCCTGTTTAAAGRGCESECGVATPAGTCCDCCGGMSCDCGLGDCGPGGCGPGGCGTGCGILDHITGLVAPSDQCFNCFISPMTNPIFFEDPRTLTEARFIYFHHKVPLTVAGGKVDLFAVQLRAALSQRLSVIATKDGFVTSSNPLIDDGWADINVGLKYNLIRDPRRQMLYTIGATYEMPVGSTRTLQGNGDGTLHLFSTCGKRIYAWNWLLAHGVIIPFDDNAESEWFYLSTHVSRKLGQSNFYFLAEMNWYDWLQSGANPGLSGVEGLDVINLGSTNVTGNDIVTGAIGLKYKPRSNVELGVAWENPLTERRDILENRLTFDCILRY